MNNSFKYIFLLIFISFIIAKLRSNNYNKILEGFVEKCDPIDILQDSILKYNIITDPQSAGSINFYSGFDIVKEAEQEQIEKRKIKYEKLKQPLSSDYMPYESILPPEFQRIKPKIKGKTIVTKPNIKATDEVSSDVKQRSRSGREIIPENACQGSWSEWNTDKCGSIDNKCGIQFRRYTITRPEISDEKGDGLPCEYKDGEIKYKYCVSQGIDLDGNQERCGVNENVCPCKLNNDTVTVLDGENVYDLVDDSCDYERKVNCSCPRGTSFIIEDEDEYKVGKCMVKECTCENGVPVPLQECRVDGSESCQLKICNEGFVLVNDPLQCVPHEGNKCNCPYGELETTPDQRCIDQTEYIIQCKQDGCLPGYKWVNNSVNQECNQYFESIGGVDSQTFNSVSCCIPDFTTCSFSDNLEKNIVLKEGSGTNNLSYYQNKTIQELLDEYNSLDILNKVDSYTILDHETPKPYLIQLIMEGKGEGENTCINSGTIQQCSSDFMCAPGYSFLPDNNHLNDSELMITNCGENIPESCEPNACDFTAGDPMSCTDGCTYIAPVQEIQESCTVDPTVEPVPDCSFIAGDSTSCGQGCLYVAPVAGVEEQCNPPLCDGFIAGDQSSCVTGCTYNPAYRSNITTWNGTCVPVSCTVPEDIKSIYNIPFDVCYSNMENCGINVSCKREEFDVPNTNKSLYCAAPHRITETNTQYELVHSGCSLNPIDTSIIAPTLEAGLDVENLGTPAEQDTGR